MIESFGRYLRKRFEEGLTQVLEDALAEKPLEDWRRLFLP